MSAVSINGTGINGMQGFARVTNGNVTQLRPLPAQDDRRAARPSAQQPSHLKLTRRGRAVLATMIIAPLVAGALFFGVNAGAAVGTDSSTPLQSVTVESGQSLWQIAAKVAPQADPRDFIEDVVSLNQLSSTTVQPGQHLDIPAQYSSH